MQKPTIGRVVRYRLTAEDIAAAEAYRAAHDLTLSHYDPGDEVTATVVREFGGGCVNLKCHLDGFVPDLWVTSRLEGAEPGNWHWPERT